MAEGIATCILQIIGEKLVAPIGRHFRYLFCYNTNFENLKDQVKKLEDIIDGVQLWVAAARNNLEVIAPPVQAWLSKAEKVKAELDSVFEDKAIVDKGFLNPKSRYLLSRKATKEAQVVGELIGEGKEYTKFSYPAPPAATEMVASTSTLHSSMGFQLRMSTTKQVMDALKNDNIGMIGICGMGGVGKTTMVEDVAKRVKSEKTFDEVAMAVVSQNQDLNKIQGHLADMLGLKLEETSILARAHRLHARLTNGKRILVILDDVWKAIDMKEIGIPFGDDRKGCKVLLTSRNKQVCSDMGTKKIFTVEVLSKQEAWNLFKEMAGECVDTADIHHTAEEVAKECGGLPLAIVTVGKALRDKQKHVWDDALGQLRKSSMRNITGMQTEVHSRIELSYNYLESDEAKSLLLLCCVYREDEEIWIESLVRNGKGLELFEDVETMEDTRNRVYSLVDQLRSSYLLVGNDENDWVKMHDVVRDVGLSIASKLYGYKVWHDTKLEEWPQKDTTSPQPYTAISLYSNKLQELPAGLDCPNLKLLWLRLAPVYHLVHNLSGEFFKGMKELKVIDFGGIYTKSSLPSSLQFLLNLRTLVLDGCTLGKDIFLIGGLQKLEILSFFNSVLHELPSEIGQLLNLKLLDMRCMFPPIILSGVLSRLKKLEELYMGDYNYKLFNPETCTSITELNSLSSLNTLQILLPDPEFLLRLRNFHFENLKRFVFSTSRSRIYAYQLGKNSVSFSGVDMSVILATNINVLMRRTEKLELSRVRGLKNIVTDLDEEGIGKLKRLEMCDCPEMEYVVDAMDSVVPSSAFIFKLESLVISDMDNLTEICHGNLPERSFEQLQVLHLYRLPAMRHLWRGPIQPPCLGNLRSITMGRCHSTKFLFPHSVVKCLVQLQTLLIYICDVMEGIVSKEEGEIHEKIIEFPKLIELKIQYLPKFRSFYTCETETEDNLGSKNNDDGGSIQSLFNPQVLLPNMENLKVLRLNILRQLVGDQIQAGSLYNLRDMSVKSCESLESVFDFERLKEHAKFMLDQLTSMYLRDLPKLTHIWRMVHQGFQGFHNLRVLEVIDCGCLRYLFSPSMAKMVVNLQELKLISCQIMEQVIQTQEEEVLDSSEMKMMDKLVFPQLRLLHLENLENLRMFCFEKHDFELPLLEKVLVQNCPNMETFCSGSITTPKLERIYVERRPNWDRDTSWKGVNLDKSFWRLDLNSTITFLKQRPEDAPEDALEDASK